MTVKESYEYLIQEESDKLMDDDQVLKEAKFAAENNGIVFLDEIDKVSQDQMAEQVQISREGYKETYYP